MNGYTFIRVAKRLGYSQQNIKTILVNNGLSCEYLDINSEPVATNEEMSTYLVKDIGKEFFRWERNNLNKEGRMRIKTDNTDKGYREATETEMTMIEILDGVRDCILLGGDKACLLKHNDMDAIEALHKLIS